MQLFFIEVGGIDLLNKINIEKNSAMADSEDITITLEKDIGNDFLLWIICQNKIEVVHNI